MATIFETTECGRCGGCGRYSFNMIHGDTCYGCGGTGRALTKRGAAARDWFKARLAVAVEDIKLGDVLMVRTMGRLVSATVSEIGSPPCKPAPKTWFWLTMPSGSRYGTDGANLVRRATQEDKDAALAYQSTLNARGK